MADGGQGFLKICMTVLPENYYSELNRASNEEDDEIIADLDGKNSTYKELIKHELAILCHKMNY